MLRAMLHGKRKGSGMQSRAAFVGAEDLLTATVFERLGYLDDECFSSILQSLPGFARVAPAVFGRLEELSFWPSLKDDSGRRVEPDVLVRFSNVTILVEAKRFDGVVQQNEAQLEKQRNAAERSLELSDRPFIQLALGGNASDSSTSGHAVADDHVVRASWKDLQIVCFSMVSASPCDTRVLADIQAGFELHGFHLLRNVSPWHLQSVARHLFPPLPHFKSGEIALSRIRPHFLTTSRIEVIRNGNQ
jgi:hypothetical protein